MVRVNCPDGYYDRTNGNANWWGCGAGCPGGSYTDGVCNCACAPNTKAPTTQAPTQPVLSKQSQSSSAPVIAGVSLVLIILIILAVLYVKKYILNKNQG